MLALRRGPLRRGQTRRFLTDGDDNDNTAVDIDMSISTGAVSLCMRTHVWKADENVSVGGRSSIRHEARYRYDSCCNAAAIGKKTAWKNRFARADVLLAASASGKPRDDFRGRGDALVSGRCPYGRCSVFVFYATIYCCYYIFATFERRPVKIVTRSLKRRRVTYGYYARTFRGLWNATMPPL